jgi:hypothetical protein
MPPHASAAIGAPAMRPRAVGTALGIVIPGPKDACQMRTPFGQTRRGRRPPSPTSHHHRFVVPLRLGRTEPRRREPGRALFTRDALASPLVRLTGYTRARERNASAASLKSSERARFSASRSSSKTTRVGPFAPLIRRRHAQDVVLFCSRRNRPNVIDSGPRPLGTSRIVEQVWGLVGSSGDEAHAPTTEEQV